MSYIVYTEPNYMILRVIEDLNELDNIYCPGEFQKKYIECPQYDPSTQKLKIKNENGAIYVTIVDKENNYTEST